MREDRELAHGGKLSSIGAWTLKAGADGAAVMGPFTGACPTQRSVGSEWACDEDASKQYFQSLNPNITFLSVIPFFIYTLTCAHPSSCGTPSNAGHINGQCTPPHPDLFIILFLFCPFIHWHMVICNNNNNILVGELVVIISSAHPGTLGSRSPLCVTQVGMYVAQSTSLFCMPCM